MDNVLKHDICTTLPSSQTFRSYFNKKMDRREIGWDGMDWIVLAQDRDQWRALVNMVMKLRVP
jgi:hypothetical protein